MHNQFIPNINLQSQSYLDNINSWSETNKAIVSQKKTKAMIVNFSKKHQFTTRLQLKGETIDIVDKMKILGCIVNNQLSWTDNCDMLIIKVNKRMQLLRKVLTFGSSNQEMVHLWIVYCRSILKQSCVVWHSALTKQNSADLELTQKTFCKLILKGRYTTYENALVSLNLIKLSERRTILCERFATQGIINNTMADLFMKNKRKHSMVTRKSEQFKVQHANKERYRKSSVIYMQTLLNHENKC